MSTKKEKKTGRSKRRPLKPTIAVCYDFDGTLSPGNMQEHSYFPELKIKSKEFWDECKSLTKKHEADEILAYMHLMLKKATASENVKISRKAFNEYGKGVELFSGVTEWFKNINTFSEEVGAKIEHYIISSGIKEMIEGTKIARHFKKIYASTFMYEQNGVAFWPAQAINYTTKTQFLFRINKQELDAFDNSKINDFVPPNERPIPFTRMIYIGDGATDVPCMKLVKDQGGYSIAVYTPRSKKKSIAEKLLSEERVNFVAPADFSAGNDVDTQVKAVITKIVADFNVLKGEPLAKQTRQLKTRKIKKAEETEQSPIN